MPIAKANRRGGSSATIQYRCRGFGTRLLRARFRIRRRDGSQRHIYTVVPRGFDMFASSVEVTGDGGAGPLDSAGMRRPALDHVRRLFRHHQNGGVEVGGDEVGHRGRIDDAQALHASHPHLRIEHGVGAKPHRARRGRMMRRDGGLADVGVDFAVGLAGRAGRGLGAAKPVERLLSFRLNSAHQQKANENRKPHIETSLGLRNHNTVQFAE